MFVLYVKSKQATFTYKKWCVRNYPMNHIYITTYVMFIFWSKLKRKLFKISNLINICCQQLIKGICNFFICLSIFAHWIKLVSISLNWDFCLEYGFIIEWYFLFYLVEIFVQTMVSLLSQSQTSFLLSWNEAQTGFFCLILNTT